MPNENQGQRPLSPKHPKDVTGDIIEIDEAGKAALRLTPEPGEQATREGQKERKNFLTPEQCAEQFRRYARSHPNEGSKHSLGFCATFLDEFCIQSPEADTKRLDWLEAQTDGRSWVARESITSRGYRLHNCGNEHSWKWTAPTARQAIDNAMQREVEN